MYQSPDKTIWKGRMNPQPQDLLWHQVVHMLDMTHDIWTPGSETNVALLGFASDEGVRRNFGRVGAQNGPDAIRKMCTGLAVHFDKRKKSVTDAGNVLCAEQKLESAFKLLEGKIIKLLEHSYFPIVLGGGHETAYPHFGALRKYFGSDKHIGIINFDAHFDMRTYENGPHSGSSFRNILDDAEKNNESFHYYPIGIRQESNVPSLFEIMHKNEQDYILLDEIQNEREEVEEKLKSYVDRMDHIYITIDMDCFPAAYAPGVSAAAPDGMLPFEVQALLKIIFQSNKVVSADIVETNPEYDDGRTAKLAATLVFDMVTVCLG